MELDLEVFARHPRQQVHFDLFAEGWEKREGTDRTATKNS